MARSILDQCIRKPREYNPNYPPAAKGGEAYPVSEGESFASIAEKLAPKYSVSAGTMAKMLLMHNFNTTSAVEVNFYLERNLKCERLTRDRKNYIFTPGQVIYLPPLSAIRKELEGSGVWFGIGLQGGGVMGLGAQTTYAWMVSLEEPLKRHFILEISAGDDLINRSALGLGGGAGAVVVIITSLFDDPTKDLRDLPVGGDWDVTVSLGGRWSEIAKSPKLARLAPLLQKAAELVKRSPKLGKYLNPEQVETLGSAVKDAIKSGALGMKTDEFIPQVEVLAVPTPIPSLELSIGVSWGYCKAYNYTDTTGVAWKRPAATAKKK